MSSSFKFGKRGRRLSTAESLVKELNTWQPKTLRDGLWRLGKQPPIEATRMELVALLARAIVEHAQQPAQIKPRKAGDNA